MPLIILAVGVALLLLLMLKFKINGFIALLVVAFLVGLAMGMPLLGDGKTLGVLDAVEKGIGGQLDDLIMILGFGAMLGTIMADQGAAHRLAMTLINKFGLGKAQIAIVIVAFLIGVVLFWETAWVILIPIVFAIVRETKVALIWLAMPLAIALSTMHSFLPPHPGPTAVAGIFDASIGLTLLYGLIMALPIGTAVALLWPRLPFVRSVNATIPAGLVEEKEFKEEDMPGFLPALLLMIFPVILIGGAAILDLTIAEEAHETLWYRCLEFIGEAPVALLIALLAAVLYFTLGRKVPMDAIMKSANSSIKAISMIIFIIAAGGAFRQVLVSSGVSDYVAEITSHWALSPLILGWAIAVIMRIALGSASVAVVAAAGIVVPLIGPGVSPELMTLAVASGSVACSHVNDPGFWMFKEFLNLSVTDTLKVRTTYTSVLAVLGLAGVMILSLFV